MLSLLPALLLALAATADAAEMPDLAYLGSERCADCHVEAAEAWSGSHHALAWTEPNEDTVLGDFDDASFEHHGVVTHFRRDGADFVIETEDGDGVRRSFPVVGVAGIAPLQQYLLAPEPGRTQTFDIAWDIEGARWYPVFPDQQLQPGDGLHWTGPYKSWEGRCAECHATGYTRNYDAAVDVYAPRLAEIGVGCEACHGPGSAHVDWAEDADGFDPADHAGVDALGLTVDLAADAETEIQQCATCHARREAHGDGNPTPGTPFHDAYTLSLLRPGLYHPDGSILEEVFDYGSFLQSKMYARGVRCTDCHEPHAGELRAEADAICSTCHSPAGNPRFPTLRPADYAAPEHHFHEPGTPGADCRSCHMIERVYMGVDGRRDHSFRIPRPDLAAETGSPDACTDCHTDRDAAWAAAEIEARYPDSPHRGPHPATTLAAGRWSPEAQADALIALASAPETAGIVRASALDLLGQVSTPAIAAASAPLLADPDPLVRAAAAGLQVGLAPAARFDALLPLLRDPTRTVRELAAKALLDALPEAPPAALPALRGALNEWQASLSSRADFPETHLQIGGAALTMRNWDAAIDAFTAATRLDPQLVDAWVMVVRIEAALERPDEARAALDAALAANPDDPRLLELARGL